MKEPTLQAKAVNIIHISDLHVGMGQQDWLWPNFKTLFLDDLRRQYKNTGPWHLVIFSGDLTQRSSAAEYQELTVILREIWEVFASLGCKPSLFTTPGNHDLVRPRELDARALTLANWWSLKPVREEFWRNPNSEYREAIVEAFSNYTTWLQDLESGGEVPLLRTRSGVLPGDASACFEGNLKIGLASLNSAWLQLNGSEWKEQLCIHPRQLMAVTDQDPDKWASAHDVNFLITHHPFNWLHTESRAQWNSEIHVRHRFLAHLFGHMHEGRLSQQSISGGPTKVSLQAASIFGLDTFGSNVKRSHGYSFLRVSKSDDGANLRIWPRATHQLQDESIKLIADPSWDMDDTYLDIIQRTTATIQQDATEVVPPDASQSGSGETSLADTPLAAQVLSNLRRSGSYSNAALAVRNEEQQLLVAALKSTRTGWIVDTWGIGGDEFVNVVQYRLLNAQNDIFYLNVGPFTGRDSFLSAAQAHIGCSVAELCRGLDQNQACILVLDDVILESTARASHEADLLETVKTLVDFSESLYVIVRSRSAPSTSGLAFVELRPLDEADVGAYVAAHDRGGSVPKGHDQIHKIFQHSGGLPARIDSLLRDIEIVGIHGLHELDADVSGKLAVRSDDTPPALAAAFEDLVSSEDELWRRAASLLKVLSLFPHGELLSRVKRFFGAKAFWPSHASLLIERGLVESAPVPSLGDAALSQSKGNALTVKRPVREFLVRSLPTNELKTLNTKALNLYFGDSWAIRGIDSPSDLDFSSAQCGIFEIGNACTLVLREVKSACESSSVARVETSLVLAQAFSAQLRRGDHFRELAELLDAAIPTFMEFSASQRDKDSSAKQIDLSAIRHIHAHGLRMIGRADRALDTMSKIDLEGASKSFREHALLTIALCKESLQAPASEIIEAAQACLAANPNGTFALNARYIIAAHQDDGDKLTKLRALHQEARQARSSVVANNIALHLVEHTSDIEQKQSYLSMTIESGRTQNDHYNFVRALLKKSTLALNDSGTPSPQQINDCIRAYSYLYSQRIDGLFEECHSVLWKTFKARGDQANLLTLYRYSSLVWRLRGRLSTEKKYRDALSSLLGSQLSRNILSVNRDLRYFLSRNAQATPQIAAPPDKALSGGGS